MAAADRPPIEAPEHPEKTEKMINTTTRATLPKSSAKFHAKRSLIWVPGGIPAVTRRTTTTVCFLEPTLPLKKTRYFAAFLKLAVFRVCPV